MANKISYTPEELTWIKKNRKMVRREAYKLFCKTFKRTDIIFDNYKALCTRRGWKTGRDGRIVKGTVPPNKGKKMPFNANSAKTQFKKGQTAHNKQPIGYEMVNKYGYVDRKINDDLKGGNCFRAVHIIRWEEINGPVPEGHCLKCLDGNKTNTDPTNWDCISRALLPRLAGKWSVPYDDAPAELKPTILKVAKLQHAVRQATKPKKQESISS